MFKKPLTNLKSFSPLRSSDRRRFQNEAYDAYPQLKEKCSQEGAMPLMPDTLQSAKFSTHIGTPGVVYVGDKNPLWIKINDHKPIPTVYTLWQHVDCLPILYTWGPVVRKLMEGADLMIPGLVPGPDGKLPNVDKDDLVAITIKGYPYPLAVGTMALPTSEIRPRSGMKGKAVHVIHVYHDYLWAMGDKSEPAEFQNTSDDESYQEDETEERVPKEEVTTQEVKDTNSVQLSTSDIDDLLKKSLLQALQFKMTPDNASTVLPLSVSNFYTTYILPSRPIDVGSEVDIKKSSWKKVQKFLKAMEKTGILKLKDQRGEAFVSSVNWSHPDFQGLKAYKSMESSEASKPVKEKESATTPTQTEIVDIYKPMGSTIALFVSEKQKTDTMYTAAEVRKILMDYIKNQNLVEPRNQRMVKIDALLCDALLAKAEYNTIDRLARDDLVQRLLSKMQPFHMLTLPGKESVLCKGKPKAVEITQEIRQGRKTVTRVTGMEGFGLDVEELCRELTKLCASSATHNPIHGSSPKNPMHEIMVQGPQIKHVSELLLGKGVPKRFIMIDDKTSKKGKGKK
ncbi:hypothetical protein EC973_008114 [Apophysomyces ossiformis]|uniref:Ligatin n=1 Tax=Apophysomyces ossiformis TaxID=679940 RepID=A0A8H7BNX4_9FUNG|nr:hypothetical protein EC973_008114 [Apophysomyces ossiformis]